MCSFASKQRKIDGAHADEYPEDTLKILKHEEFTVASNICLGAASGLQRLYLLPVILQISHLSI